MKIDLLAMSIGELQQLMAQWGQPPFRAKQLYGWLLKGVPFTQMKNLPQDLREKLELQAVSCPVVIKHQLHSFQSDTCKFLYELQDGHIIEGVRMHYEHGFTLCLSTQVGCRMGCRFCASTADGLARNLTASEMLGQVIAAGVDLPVPKQGRAITNLVLMGCGEPLDNYDETVRFIRQVNDPAGLGFSCRNISLSTCGLVPGMKRLIHEDLPITLSVSLHASDDETRRKIMPVASRYSISEIMNAAREMMDKTGRRVIIEYTLIQDVNDSVAQANALASLLRGLGCHVNVMMCNTVADTMFVPPSDARTKAFIAALQQQGISVTRRRELGLDIQGACGQLRKHFTRI